VGSVAGDGVKGQRYQKLGRIERRSQTCTSIWVDDESVKASVKKNAPVNKRGGGRFETWGKKYRIQGRGRKARRAE